MEKLTTLARLNYGQQHPGGMEGRKASVVYAKSTGSTPPSRMCPAARCTHDKDVSSAIIGLEIVSSGIFIPIRESALLHPMELEDGSSTEDQPAADPGKPTDQKGPSIAEFIQYSRPMGLTDQLTYRALESICEEDAAEDDNNENANFTSNNSGSIGSLQPPSFPSTSCSGKRKPSGTRKLRGRPNTTSNELVALASDAVRKLHSKRSMNFI